MQAERRVLQLLIELGYAEPGQSIDLERVFRELLRLGCIEGAEWTALQQRIGSASREEEGPLQSIG